MPSQITPPPGRVSTGVPGLDDILGGGLTRDRLYLIEGTPGTGKTTLSLQFLLDGAANGEWCMYITLSETAAEIHAVAATHGWSLDGITVVEMVTENELDRDTQQTILHPSEFELGETAREVMRRVDIAKPRRVVFDSLSELRLLAQNPFRYRRQILALKHFFATRACTVLMLDDRTSDTSDLQLHSIPHGVISLEQAPRDFGAERRRLRVVKMRGIKFRGGYNDFVLDTGGLQVFPRLVAAEHHAAYDRIAQPTGCDGLDALLGGGLVPGTNTLLTGPSGAGKTTVATRCLYSALQTGQRCTYYLFDEGVQTFLDRGANLGMDLRPFIESGQFLLHQIDPAELSPGEFAHRVRSGVEHMRARLTVIDSLNAYLQSMPGERHLILQMHEMLSYLNQQGATTLMVLGQHGLLGDVRSDVDLSYLSDTIILFRYFEAQGRIRTALSVTKSRMSAHEHTIREMRLGPQGVEIGQALTDFQGVLSGVPSYHGAIGMLPSTP